VHVHHPCHHDEMMQHHLPHCHHIPLYSAPDWMLPPVVLAEDLTLEQ
jgi:hypothetical protein